MDCVNHSGVAATAYCQNCGKALCAGCVRSAAAGQILCEPCWIAWHSFQQPFVAPHPDSPNPAVAAMLGLIPGVGAMFNGQFLKGLIHVAIFAVLVSMANHHDVFGFFVAAWIFYQVFDAYHTAKARRDGLPLPDPLGLNEVSHWMGLGGRPISPVQPGPVAGAAAYGQPAPGSPMGTYPPPYAGQYQNPYQASPNAPPPIGFPPVPPVPPPPPLCWRRREPIAAVVLIALGVIFLLGQFDIFSGRVLQFTWPVLLIALGGWLLVRRLHDSSVGSGPVSNVPSGSDAAAPSPGHERADSQNDSQGGSQ